MKNFFLFLILLITLFNLNSYVCFAGLLDTSEVHKQADALREKAGFEKDEYGEGIGKMVATIIKAFLSLLGIIFVILIVMAGYKWMMARGNEEKIKEAGDEIRRAIIGLIIVVSAYAIAYFVFTNLPGGGSGGPG